MGRVGENMEIVTEPSAWDEFKSFRKIPRLSRDIVITEKIDGTNASVSIDPTGTMIKAASRTRWISVGSDNFGFAKFVEDNKEELLKLGPGRHFGEWFGCGIQRKYGLNERRFALFNPKWNDNAIRPKCCTTVPILYTGPFNTEVIDCELRALQRDGSHIVIGYNRPEGIVIFHSASGAMFKKTIEDDEKPKGAQSADQ